MTNHTVVEAVNATSSAVDVGTAVSLFFTVLLPELLRRFFVFIAAPFLYLDIWWLLIHLILTFVLFEFYFDRHRNENLGWSAALANSIVMVFIGSELLHMLYRDFGNPFLVLWHVLGDYVSLGFFSEQMIIVTLTILLVLFGLTTAVINYYHAVPKKVAFLISGHKTVNLLAYFLIVVVFTFEEGNPLPIDGITLTALLLFGLLLWFLLRWINHKVTQKAAGRARVQLFK